MHQNVTAINFGPSPRLDNATAAVELGFELGYGTVFRTVCGNTGQLVASSSYMDCVNPSAYCSASPPFTTISWWSTGYGDMFYTIPEGVSGLRLKVQRTHHDYNGNSFVAINGNAIWSTSSCSTPCPVIVTATVEPGDTLWFREWDDSLALFWMELWEHTRWPTEVLTTSDNSSSSGGLLCSVCPTNYTGPTCLPIPYGASIDDYTTPTATIVPNSTMAAGDDYVVVLSANGSMPRVWIPETSHGGLRLSGSQLTWTQPECSTNPYVITATVLNPAGGDTVSWSVTVECLYSALVTHVSDAVAAVPSTVELRGNATGTGSRPPCSGGNETVHLNIVGSSIGGISTQVTTGPACEWLYQIFVYAYGEYNVSARHPNDNRELDAPQLSFQAIGIIASPRSQTLRVSTGDTNASSLFTITNPTERVLVNLSVAVADGSSVGALSNLSFAFNATELGSGDVADLSAGFSTSSSTYARVALLITASYNGVAIPTTVVLVVHATEPPTLLPLVTFTPFSLTGQAELGRQTLFTFNATNVGVGSTGDVWLQVPNDGMLSVVAPLGTINLASRQTVTITIMATPNTSLGGGVYTGQIDLTGERSQSALGVRFFLVSSRATELIVQLQDERTFLGTVRTNWTGASVSVVSQLTLFSTTVYANSSGYAVFPRMPTGLYAITAQVVRHVPQRRVLMVSGLQHVEIFFLQFQLISFTWSVTPVALIDSYKFALDIMYATDVPAPVVVVLPAFIDLNEIAERQQTNLQFTITNHGSIDALNPIFYLPTGMTDMTFEPLVPLPSVLSPNVTIVFPVRIVHTNITTRRRRSVGSCKSALLYEYDCGGVRDKSTPVPVLGGQKRCEDTAAPGSGNIGIHRQKTLVGTGCIDCYIETCVRPRSNFRPVPPECNFDLHDGRPSYNVPSTHVSGGKTRNAAPSSEFERDPGAGGPMVLLGCIVNAVCSKLTKAKSCIATANQGVDKFYGKVAGAAARCDLQKCDRAVRIDG